GSHAPGCGCCYPTRRGWRYRAFGTSCGIVGYVVRNERKWRPFCPLFKYPSSRRGALTMTATKQVTSMGNASLPNAKQGLITEIKEYLDSRAGLDYLMLRIIIFLLIGICVIIVFSSSMATSYVQSTGVWADAIRQTLMVCLGLFMFWLALRLRPS